MRVLGRVFDIITNILAFASSAILVAMMLMTVIKVVMRAVFNHGILGIDQISGVMMVYMTFLGAAWVLRSDSHVSVDLFTEAASPKLRRILLFLSSLIGAAVCFVLTWFGTKAVSLSISRSILVAAELEIPRAVNLIVIPFGCLLLGIEFLRRSTRLYRNKPIVKNSVEA